MPKAKAKAAEKPIDKAPEKTSGATVHARHVAAALDAVGRSLGKTFSGFGFAIVLFDKRKPEQHQTFLGGDARAAKVAMEASIKKMGS